MSAAPSSLRPPARRTGVWVVGVLLCSALVVGLYEYFVRSYSGQLTEFSLLQASEYFDHPLPTLDLSQPLNMALVISVPAALVLIIAISRGAYLSGLVAAGTVLASNLTTQALKAGWEEKPVLEAGPPWPQYWLDNTLPSGHTTVATSVAVAAFLVAGPRYRPLIAVLTAFFAATVGAYTYIETWHTPADVAAAYLVVAAWGLIGGWLIMRLEPRKNTVLYDRVPVIAPSAGFCWFLGVVLCLGAVLCLFLAGGWSAMTRSAEDPSLWHWAAGVLLTAAPGFLVSAAGIHVFTAETGRRQHGADVPSPRGERAVYPVPPELRELYDSV